MRKYLIGGIVGFLLAFGVSAHAEVVSMIGKVIDGAFPIKVDGNTLADQAIVVEGTSYLPVRAFSDATGYDVKFDADLGITLTKKPIGISGTPVAPNPTQQMPPKITAVGYNTIIINGDKKQNGDFSFVEIDGNQYVSLSILGGVYNVKFNNPNVTISKDSMPDISINVRNDYTTNTDGFQAYGASYVKLSSLGLKATVNGDTLVIDKQ